MADQHDQSSEANTRAYGAHLGNCFGLVETPSYVQRSIQRGVIAATQVSLSRPRPELTSSLGEDEAFIIVVPQADIVDHELWIDGAPYSTAPLLTGKALICGLDRDPRARIFQPATAMHFYFPLASLNAFAEHHDLTRITTLQYEPGISQDDPVLSRICEVIGELLNRPEEATPVLLDQILNAACAHTLVRYGKSSPVRAHRGRGLSRWQERRAKELMDETLNVPLADLAAQCQLSVTHFVRSFRLSTGMSPHKWMIDRRIEKAKELLTAGKLNIAEIALTCGFSSQSHLNSAFTARIGVPPGRWRRSHEPAALGNGGMPTWA